MREIKKIGGQDFPQPGKGEKIQYVLDGQQRITSLYAAYKGLEIQKPGEAKPTDYKNIYVDLENSLDSGEQIITHEKPEGEHVTLYQVLNYKPSSKDIRPEDVDVDKIDDYRTKFRTYGFSTILLMKDDVASAVEVFTRINTGGKTLTLFEIMCAVTYDEARGFDMQDRWKKFIEKLEDIKYGGIPSSIILNILGLVLKKECKRNVILNIPKKDIIDNWDKAISSLECSIEYFRNSYGIPVSELLPYETLLVPFSYFFFENEQGPNSEQKKYLEEFFWRASLSYRYSGATETALFQDIRRIDKIRDEYERPEYDGMNKISLSKKSLIEKEFRTGESYCKAILCLLASKKPKDFYDNSDVRLDAAWLKAAHSRNYHHFFPKAHLKEKDPDQENINSLMNITFISDKTNKQKIGAKAPSKYIAEFAEKNNEIEQSLRSHFIEINGFGIQNDDYKMFLSARAEAIFQELKSRIVLLEEEMSDSKLFDIEMEPSEEASLLEKLSVPEVCDLIAGGESDKVEFKSTLRYDIKTQEKNSALEYSVMKNIAAFMNTDGGYLIIGVDDNGNVVGIENDINLLNTKNKDGFSRSFMDLFTNFIGYEFSHYIKVEFLEIDGKVVCVATIQRAIHVESTFIEDSNGKRHFYIRVGATCRSLSAEEQNKYIRTKMSSL